MTATIVKFGGGLARSPRREAWIATLVAWGGPLILVPGGGPFAEAVRREQREMGFDDLAAHRMALLAMEQFGVALRARSEAFVLATSRGEMDAALQAGRIPIWLPSAMALAAPELPASWELTSDSLAAWLAGAYGARRLLLIKSCDVSAPASARDLAAKGVVDPMFPRFSALSGAEVRLAGPAALDGAGAILHSGGLPGAFVTLS